MPKQIITSATTPTIEFTDKDTLSPLARGIRRGNMGFVSGLAALDSETREVVSDDIAEQTVQTLRNLEGVLDVAGVNVGIDRIVMFD